MREERELLPLMLLLLYIDWCCGGVEDDCFAADTCILRRVCTGLIFIRDALCVVINCSEKMYSIMRI